MQEADEYASINVYAVSCLICPGKIENLIGVSAAADA